MALEILLLPWKILLCPFYLRQQGYFFGVAPYSVRPVRRIEIWWQGVAQAKQEPIQFCSGFRKSVLNNSIHLKTQ